MQSKRAWSAVTAGDLIGRPGAPGAAPPAAPLPRPLRRGLIRDNRASLFADATRDAVGLFGKLQSPFDQSGDRVARQIRMVFPNGFRFALP